MNQIRQKSELIQWLGPGASLAIVVGTMIGTGIFLSPGGAAAAAGSLAWAYAAWIAAGVLSLFGALIYCELGIAIPQPGGTYAFLGRGLGPSWGYLYGWTHSVLSGPASQSSIAAGMARFCLVLSPALAGRVWGLHNRYAHFDLSWADSVAVAAILAVTALNYFGLRMGGRVQVGLTAIKFAALAGIVAAAFFLAPGGAPTAAAANPAPAGGSFSGFLVAIVAALWAYDGWAMLSKTGSEVKDPRRNVPVALIWGVIVVGVLYLLFNAACLRVLPFGAMASSRHVASDVIARLAGGGAVFWVTLLMAVAALGSLNSAILTAARTPYAMARDGVFFPVIGRVHPIRHTPGGALLYQGTMSSLFVLTGSFEELTSLFVFATWLFHGLSAVALFRLRYREPELSRGYRCWGYPWVPGFFVLSAVVLCSRGWFRQPVRCSIGLALMLSGLFFRRYWQRRSMALSAADTQSAAA
jgi:APA family basic amino acid/polyamine antiporter